MELVNGISNQEILQDLQVFYYEQFYEFDNYCNRAMSMGNVELAQENADISSKFLEKAKKVEMAIEAMKVRA